MRRLRRAGGEETGGEDQNSQVEQAHTAEKESAAAENEITNPSAVLGPEATQAAPGRRRRATSPEAPTEPTQAAPAASSAEPQASVRATGSDQTIGGNTGLVNRVVVTLGEETYSPRQYHTYRVGPFTAETQLRAGETLQGAIARLTLELELAFVLERKRKRAIYMAEIGG